jgi:hypothetical protein
MLLAGLPEAQRDLLYAVGPPRQLIAEVTTTRRPPNGVDPRATHAASSRGDVRADRTDRGARTRGHAGAGRPGSPAPATWRPPGRSSGAKQRKVTDTFLAAARNGDFEALVLDVVSEPTAD